MTLTKTYRIWITIGKWLLAIIGFAFIYKQVFLKSEYELLKSNFINYYTVSNIIYFLIPAAVLVFVNWGVESYKWKHIIKPLENIGMVQALKGVLAGVATGFFTPNRVGEFGGRILYLNHADKISSSISTIAGSFAQLIATVMFGCLAMVAYNIDLHLTNYYITALLFFIAVLLISSLLLLYYNFSKLADLISLRLYLPRFYDKFAHLKNADSTYLSKIMWLSVLRYFTFCIQYILLLYFFQVNISIEHAFICVSVIYLLHTAIPTVAIIEAGVRGAGALAVIGSYTQQPTEILLAAYTLWIINIILPSLLGLYLIARINIKN
ncbi:MAG: lysylphosphatidylglycerol synthase domain-containing protein [Bacteroidota bacterium]|nr:lysylphosphatidylglycerol synthase domain-containing protein [Bacteroidota bacterium]